MIDIKALNDIVRQRVYLERLDVKNDQLASAEGLGENSARQQHQLIFIQSSDRLVVS